MDSQSQTQIDPLPTTLPFEIISRTIGRGAYASVKKGRSSDGRVFAVKFIHKESAFRNARLKPKQLRAEAELHKYCEAHENVIRFFGTGEDDVWLWLAMEYAAGGDLFDKIEADQGLPEDIAHFYFTQLVSGVSWLHGKGVAHRDIKPENILLDGDGNLKIADFGLAVLFQYQGKYRESESICGSPPYVAPEVVSRKYRGDRVDIWSCGVVLFVLLAGNTPWDEPTYKSAEFQDYVRTEGRPSYDPWPTLPQETLSLLRAMMRLDQHTRFTFDNIRQHPWYTRPNPLIATNGRCKDGTSLAVRLMENLHIDFNKLPSPRPQAARSQGSLLSASQPFASTQPITPSTDAVFEWEKSHLPFASQPTVSRNDVIDMDSQTSQTLLESLAEDPTMSQFAPQPRLSQSLTQRARKFEDICPQYRLTRFFSLYPIHQLLPILCAALHRVGVATHPLPENMELITEKWLPIRGEDKRRCPLRGDVIVRPIVADSDVLEVTFSKNVGDPVEWRRFFKEVVVLAKEAVYTGQ